MKRCVTFLTLIFSASIIVGCGGGGIEVGAPEGAPQGGQTSEFKEAMEKAGKKMMTKKKPADASGAPKTGP